MTKEQGDEFIKALRQIMSQQSDLGLLAAKLNGCLEATAPRTLKPDQIAAIANAVSGFTGEPIQLSIHADDQEAWNYAKQITVALGAAVIVQDSSNAIGVAPGLFVSFGKNREAFASAFGRGLVAAGLYEFGKIPGKLQDNAPNEFVIMVGPKPVKF
jgi:hypothetical protein